jgi:tetratricopeptide (TPR) repeat protein
MSKHLDDALPLLRDASQRRQRILGADHPSTIASVAAYANVLNQLGHAGEAEPLLREAVARCRKVFGPEHPNTIMTISRWAQALSQLGRHDEAAGALGQALDRARTSLGQDHPTVLQLTYTQAKLLVAAGRFADAEPLFRELVAKGDSGHIPPAQAAAIRAELDQCLKQLHKPEAAGERPSPETATKPASSLGAAGTSTAAATTSPTR